MRWEGTLATNHFWLALEKLMLENTVWITLMYLIWLPVLLLHLCCSCCTISPLYDIISNRDVCPCVSSCSWGKWKPAGMLRSHMFRTSAAAASDTCGICAAAWWCIAGNRLLTAAGQTSIQGDGCFHHGFILIRWEEGIKSPVLLLTSISFNCETLTVKFSVSSEVFNHPFFLYGGSQMIREREQGSGCECVT